MAIEKINPLKQQAPLLTTETNGLTNEPFAVTEFDDGSIEFNFDEEEVLNEADIEKAATADFEANLAEEIDEHELQEIGEDVFARYDNDKQSRKEWIETVAQGLALLGLKVEQATQPFPGACGAYHPLIIESAVKFQAKASNELFSPKGPVKTQILGKPTEEKEAQADRVNKHMNYQIMHQMDEYFDEMETLLFYLPIVGSAFKKTFYDSLLDRPCSIFVPVDNFVVNYFANNLKTAPCFTHVIQRSANDFRKDVVNGMYRDVDVGRPTYSAEEQGELQEQINETMGFNQTPSVLPDEGSYTLLEQYVYLDLPGKFADKDGIAYPYVVTVELDSRKVLAIRRNWLPEDEDRKEMLCPFTHYKFVPGMGFYGLGYIHLLGNLQMTLTSTMRSLVDAGTFANLQAGFVDKRLRIRDNNGPLSPGQFKEVEAGGIDLDKAIKLIPFREPSQVLLAMYEFIEARGQKFADTTEQIIAESTNYGPVGTTLALLEASQKFFSGVHKRLHNAQKQEFKILANLNHKYLEDSLEYHTVGETFEISKKDYDGRVDIIPLSDPNTSSQSQRLTVAQTIHTAALQNPQIHNLREVSKYYYNAIGVDNTFIEKFVPPEEQPQEADPLTDIQMVQQGKPIKAFPGQDHDSHIAVKAAFLQDPQAGANPMMANIAPVIQANIQEHMILKFKTQVAAQTAMSEVPPEQGVEGQIIAQAAQKIAQNNQKMAEMEALGEDAAKNKLAEAEILRAINEGRQIEIDSMLRQADLTLKALKIEMDKVKEENKMALAGLSEENKKNQAEMQQMSKLLSEAVKLIGQNRNQKPEVDTE